MGVSPPDVSRAATSMLRRALRRCLRLALDRILRTCSSGWPGASLASALAGRGSVCSEWATPPGLCLERCSAAYITNQRTHDACAQSAREAPPFTPSQ